MPPNAPSSLRALGKVRKAGLRQHRWAALLTGILLSFPAIGSSQGARPNILLIMADDLGYSDLGCYGSSIETPALDRLASQGTRLANFRVDPMCTVTRTSLLTGHTHTQSANYRRSFPLPKALSIAGYQTSLSGKWHQPKHPLDQGFDHFYGFLQGQINNFTGDDSILRQRKKAPVPEDWYATDSFTDHTIECIDRAIDDDKPFFAFLSYNAPHTPLHVSRELVEKHRGRFSTGWGELRQQRFNRLKEIGLIDERHVLSEPGPEVRRWDELPEETRTLEDFRMATYAAVIDRLDQNVARLLRHLDKKGIADNTLVIFLSDNGGDYGNGNIATDAKQLPWDKSSLPYMSNGWASLKCTPFKYYKTSAYEGGLRVPFIMRWPKGLKHQPGTILSHQTHVTDLYPTFLELAGTSYRPTGKQAPLHGKSFLPLIRDADLPKEATLHPTFWALDSTTRGYLDYPWKAVSIHNGPWQLYHLEKDPAEANDLAGSHPEQLAEIDARWNRFAAEETAMPPDWRLPLKETSQGWGFHRLVRIWNVEDSIPRSSAAEVPVDTELSFTFRHPLDFKGTGNKTLRLYRVQDPDTPVWTADPDASHPAQGKKTITFTDLPKLKPDTSYFLLSDPGWARSNKKPLPPLNDGAYWFRFRTAK
ncbi:sulfatase-like hydrolase/transferase [Haloferula chungangensis]|uniref:Sulfatase-like hydrolase/transferase n=1 Tax=Haloferula chungangensis TaxID=1048331 RepID=A0ABW2L0Z9_9BACT